MKRLILVFLLGCSLLFGCSTTPKDDCGDWPIANGPCETKN